jgi:acetylornithine deacetylase/succinyl-diaminopimelate desuccinylase-like protein
VSKCDFSTYAFAVRALEAVVQPKAGTVELLFTYDEEFGGEVGPGWLLKHKVIHPDLMIAAGFSYQVITAHNGCLQMEVTVHGKMAHAAIPDSGVDALQAAVQILNALYAQNTLYKQVCSAVEGITHPYLNVGMIEGGTNTNVIPGRVTFKLDRRMIPEENPADVEATLRRVIADAAATGAGRHGGSETHAAGQCDEAADGQPAAGGRDPEAWPDKCSASHSRARHPAVHRRAPVLRGRHPRRDLWCRPAHRAGVACQAGR